MQILCCNKRILNKNQTHLSRRIKLRISSRPTFFRERCLHSHFRQSVPGAVPGQLGSRLVPWETAPEPGTAESVSRYIRLPLVPVSTSAKVRIESVPAWSRAAISGLYRRKHSSCSTPGVTSARCHHVTPHCRALHVLTMLKNKRGRYYLLLSVSLDEMTSCLPVETANLKL